MQQRYGRLEGPYKEALNEKLAAARKHVRATQTGHEPSSAEAPPVYPKARKASTPAGGYVRHALYVEQQGGPAKPPARPEFIDNTGALSALVTGGPRQEDNSRLVGAYHAFLIGLRTRSEFVWVPSDANIADWPTRSFGRSYAAAIDASVWWCG